MAQMVSDLGLLVKFGAGSKSPISQIKKQDYPMVPVVEAITFSETRTGMFLIQFHTHPFLLRIVIKMQ
jgi:hypothetical protein